MLTKMDENEIRNTIGDHLKRMSGVRGESIIIWDLILLKEMIK